MALARKPGFKTSFQRHLHPVRHDAEHYKKSLHNGVQGFVAWLLGDVARQTWQQKVAHSS